MYLLPVDVSKIAAGVSNGVDPNQMQFSAASYLGLQFTHACSNIVKPVGLASTFGKANKWLLKTSAYLTQTNLHLFAFKGI